MLADKKTSLSEIAPRIITFAYPKKKAILDVKSLITAFEELTVGLEITSIEYQSKAFKDHWNPVIFKYFYQFCSYRTVFSSDIQQLIAIRLLPHVMQNPKKKLSKSEVERLFCPYFKVVIIFHYTPRQSCYNSLKKFFRRNLQQINTARIWITIIRTIR